MFEPTPAPCGIAGNFVGTTLQDIEETQWLGRAGKGRSWLEVKMILFSRAFIRKRVVSLATTASVTATSFALADNPPRMHHLRRAAPIQYVADWAEHSEERPFPSENITMNTMMASLAIRPSGAPDHHFAEMIQLRQLAQDIVAHQQQGITMMPDATSGERSSISQPSEQLRAQVAQQSATDDVVAHSLVKIPQ